MARLTKSQLIEKIAERIDEVHGDFAADVFSNNAVDYSYRELKYIYDEDIIPPDIHEDFWTKEELEDMGMYELGYKMNEYTDYIFLNESEFIEDIVYYMKKGMFHKAKKMLSTYADMCLYNYEMIGVSRDDPGEMFGIGDENDIIEHFGIGEVLSWR